MRLQFPPGQIQSLTFVEGVAQMLIESRNDNPFSEIGRGQNKTVFCGCCVWWKLLEIAPLKPGLLLPTLILPDSITSPRGMEKPAGEFRFWTMGRTTESTTKPLVSFVLHRKEAKKEL